MIKEVKMKLIIIAAIVLLFLAFAACKLLNPGGIIKGPALFDSAEHLFDDSVFGE